MIRLKLLKALKASLNDILNASWDDVQGTDIKSCGNYRDHSLFSAKEWCQKDLG